MKKKELTKEVKKEIKVVKEKIIALKAKKEKATEPTYVDEFREEIQQLQERRKTLEGKYEELVEMAEEKWDDVKESFKDGLVSVSKKFKKLFD